MNKELSLKISGYISQKIINEALSVEYTKNDLKKKRSALQVGDSGDLETNYVLDRFCEMLKLNEVADTEYIEKLYSVAKRHTVDDFYSDPYLKNIKVPTACMGDVLLLNACYEKGELFQYDMPSLSDEIVVSKLGFFDTDVFFPAVYEGNMPWVSVCPSEINSMKKDVDKAFGRCLVLGLGLGYYPYVISLSDKVKSITVVEISDKIIALFEKYILPQFPHKEKIKIVKADAIEFMKSVDRNEYDYCYADIWEGQVDGAPLYLEIKENEKRLPYTRFAYWIEDEIRWYIENCI